LGPLKIFSGGNFGWTGD